MRYCYIPLCLESLSPALDCCHVPFIKCLDQTVQPWAEVQGPQVVVWPGGSHIVFSVISVCTICDLIRLYRAAKMFVCLCNLWK